MVKIEIFDYLILTQMVLSIIVFSFTRYEFKSLLVFLSLISFFSYWMIRIVFNKKYVNLIGG